MSQFQDFQVDVEFKSQKLLQFVFEKKLKSGEDLAHVIKILEKTEILEGHKTLASRQQNEYRLQLKSKTFLKGKILLDIDFKQKIKSGMSGNRQVNSQYYSQTQNSCLGKYIL